MLGENVNSSSSYVLFIQFYVFIPKCVRAISNTNNILIKNKTTRVFHVEHVKNYVVLIT